jgi:metallophosphoesterase superfamily enzyme
MKDGRKIICMPAFSPLASGVTVNAIEKRELLSPILREDVELENLVPIAIDKEVGVLKFPELRLLRVSP